MTTERKARNTKTKLSDLFRRQRRECAIIIPDDRIIKLSQDPSEELFISIGSHGINEYTTPTDKEEIFPDTPDQTFLASTPADKRPATVRLIQQYLRVPTPQPRDRGDDDDDDDRSEDSVDGIAAPSTTTSSGDVRSSDTHLQAVVNQMRRSSRASLLNAMQPVTNESTTAATPETKDSISAADTMVYKPRHCIDLSDAPEDLLAHLTALFGGAQDERLSTANLRRLSSENDDRMSLPVGLSDSKKTCDHPAVEDRLSEESSPNLNHKSPPSLPVGLFLDRNSLSVSLRRSSNNNNNNSVHRDSGGLSIKSLIFGSNTASSADYSIARKSADFSILARTSADLSLVRKSADLSIALGSSSSTTSFPLPPLSTA